MAQIANLTLTDAAATPVGHTYVPVDCTSLLASWKETSVGVPIGMPTLTLAVTEGGDNYNVTGKLSLPVLETISGDDNGYVAVPKVAFTNIGTFKFSFSKRSTLQQRKDMKAMLIDAMGEAPVTAAVESFERPF